MNRFTTRLHVVPHAKLKTHTHKKKRTFKDFKEQTVTVFATPARKQDS